MLSAVSINRITMSSTLTSLSLGDNKSLGEAGIRDGRRVTGGGGGVNRRQLLNFYSILLRDSEEPTNCASQLVTELGTFRAARQQFEQQIPCRIQSK